MTSSQRGPTFGAAPYRSREGLTTRPVSNLNEVQVQIDPMHADLDEEIVGLHRKVKQLKNVAQEIGSEAKYQTDYIAQLQMTLIKAQAGVKNNMRRLLLGVIKFLLLLFVVLLKLEFSQENVNIIDLCFTLAKILYDVLPEMIKREMHTVLARAWLEPSPLNSRTLILPSHIYYSNLCLENCIVGF
ncbi:hypothetical protein NE237_016979 [Protea cynaroides]|uniref:t-SNARE coiled-coil homology domain-containing protein n=1 Tax=Protea cynaroides TaxID=273540 RepID=A0A9Q0QMA8_9MAGN|nr:hypothetical protein NE237_016979 [Protea cynaroides]